MMGLGQIKMSYKIFIETYGCPSNKADSEIMVGLLKESGFDITDSPEKSDINIINTCVVKTPTEQRMIHRIRKLTELGKPLVIAGCMPKTEKRIIERINPKASLLGPDSIEKIVDVAYATMQGKKVVFLEDLRRPKVCLPRIRKNPKIGIVEISSGCLSNCSYCIVKFARGRLHSYPVEKIVDEVKRAIKDGCTEIWLTSQDNGCYGLDIGNSLPELLNEVCKVDGDFTIRVGMMNPTHVKQITDELIDAYKDKKILKFLHLPVQSGSNKILKSMKRGYTVEDFLHIVKKFRKEFPGIRLVTDIIVGFPGETEYDFKKTIELIKKIKPNKVNISKFMPRPGTEAEKMKQLDVKTIKKRSVLLANLVKRIKRAS